MFNAHKYESSNGHTSYFPFVYANTFVKPELYAITVSTFATILIYNVWLWGNFWGEFLHIHLVLVIFWGLNGVLFGLFCVNCWMLMMMKKLYIGLWKYGLLLYMEKWSTAAHGGMFNVHQYESSRSRMFINTNWASTHELNCTYTIWCSEFCICWNVPMHHMWKM